MLGDFIIIITAPQKYVICHAYAEIPVIRTKQYKTQLKKWSLDTKYTKSSEYMAMIKTKRRRERENPPKQTQFFLHGKPISDKDITRFEKRAIKKGLISQDSNLSDEGKCFLLLFGPEL